MDAGTRKALLEDLERGVPLAEAAEKAGLSAEQVAAEREADPEFGRAVARAAANVRGAIRRRMTKAALEGDLSAATIVLEEEPAPAPVDGTFPRHGLSTMRRELVRSATDRLAKRLHGGGRRGRGRGPAVQGDG